MSYDFISWEEDGIWTAHAPSVPGAYGLGDTPAEAKADLKESILSLLEYLEEISEEPPKAISIIVGQIRV